MKVTLRGTRHSPTGISVTVGHDDDTSLVRRSTRGRNLFGLARGNFTISRFREDGRYWRRVARGETKRDQFFCGLRKPARLNDGAIRESRRRHERRIHRWSTGCTRSRRRGSFDMHRACARLCFRSGVERESLRFQARRERKVNPVARSMLIARKSLDILIAGAKPDGNLNREIFPAETFQRFQISQMWDLNSF